MSFIPTNQQKKIFEFFRNGKGHGMIDAVAGSGKTTTIINGIDYIDKKLLILFCAFNKKIQLEIQKKTQDKENVIVKTTYALGLNILRYNYDIFKNKSPDTSKYYNILNDKLKKKNDSYEYESPSLFSRTFDSIKNHYYSNKKKEEPDIFHKTFFSNYYRLTDLLRYTLSYSKGIDSFKNLVEKYSIDINPEDNRLIQLYKRLVENAIKIGSEQAIKNGMYDFADMIFLPCEFRLRSASKFDIVFIDECQDLSNAQLKTIRKHLKENGRLFAVGDPFQSIYGFAGASHKSFENVKRVFKPTMFLLTNCFRCGKSIVDLAKEIRPDIVTTNENLGEIIKIKFNAISELAIESDYVLSRHNADLFEVLFELLKKNKKCKIVGKADILKGLKKLIPTKFFQNTSYYENLTEHLERLYRASEAALGGNPSNFEKLENLRDSINVIETCYLNAPEISDLNGLFKHIEKLMDSNDNESVILSTIHRAKGLEGKRVFIIGYDNLPIKKEEMQDWQLYQEKCLKYVAITRAKNILFLSESKPDRNDIAFKDVFDENEECDLDDEIDLLPI